MGLHAQLGPGLSLNLACLPLTNLYFTTKQSEMTANDVCHHMCCSQANVRNMLVYVLRHESIYDIFES